jgi:hypothetical protein
MKKIILGLILLVLTTENSFAKQITLYCIEVLELNNNRASKLSTQVVVRSEQEIVSQILKTQNPDWCGAIFNKGELEMVELPEEVYLKIQDRINSFYKEQERAFFKTDPQMQAVHLTKVVMSESWSAIESHRNKRISQKAEYADKALINEENKKKQLLAKKPNVEENKRKQLITEKQKVEEEKANKLLASMKPEERRSYICEKTYGFRKGSDKFGDCVFKIMAADLEIEKLEMQRKITEAQIEANKKSSTSYDPSVGRAAERAVDIEAARFKREQELETARLAFALSKGLGTPGGINSKIQGTADALNPNQRQVPAQNNNPFPKQTYCKLNPINNRISCYTTP